MNIQVISQIFLPEPAGIFAGDLVDRWCGQGHQVTVWTATGGSHRSDADVVRTSDRGEYDRRSLVGRVTSQVRFFRSAASGFRRKCVHGGPPDRVVVVGSPALASMLPMVTRASRSSRVVQWVYDIYPDVLSVLRPRDPLVRALGPFIKQAVDRSWRSADTVVAISPAMADGIRQRAPGANVQTIPLWAPDAVHPRSDRAIGLRRSRRIPDDAFVLTYHGNLGLAYDFEPVLQAAKQLAAEPEFVFAIVGAGAQLEAIRTRVMTERLANVRLIPPTGLEQLPDSLAMGDCHVVGLRDGWSGIAFPSKFITAIAAGRPVMVLSRPEAEMARIVCAEMCGTMVRPTGRDLVDALRFLRLHPDVLRDQGAAGRNLYDRQFDRKTALARWDELIGS